MDLITVSNEDFIATLFGVDAPWCHVTDHPYDPGAIPKEQHLRSWKGDYYSRYTLTPNTNQYFTISTFYCDDEQQARRRKALFRHTHVIVLDDVKEKLSMVEVNKLPAPTWILESSVGSEQWGYLLDVPCDNRGRVENLLDGLVANGLAPQGKDPGMKGVTRYVRLPEGVNMKAAKLVNGLPFRCRMTKWQPQLRVTMEQLAHPFSVNLDAARREQRVDGAAEVSDHPLINIPDIIHIKEVRSDGRFDITCPWVHEHTGSDDSGAAVFTNSDLSMGFKCHHGACQSRTGADLLRLIESRRPGFSGTLKNWQIMRQFDTFAPISFMDAAPAAPDAYVAPVAPDSPVHNGAGPVDSVAPVARDTTNVAPLPAVSFLTPNEDALQLLCDRLRRQVPGTSEQRSMASAVLKATEDLPQIDRNHWHDQISDIMRWSKIDFKSIIADLRRTWYIDRVSIAEFYDNVVFVKEQNQFYDWSSRIFFSTEAFQNAFSHEDAEARKIALQDGRVEKVDRLDYAPKKPRIFEEKGCRYANTWSENSMDYGAPGDVTRWRDHFDAIGWAEHREHVERWMAFTLRHPDQKINHMLLMGSGEGVGKDFILYPLIEAMGDNTETIDGDELLSDFRDFLLTTKYLHVNEADLGDHQESTKVANKLKPLTTAPPNTLRVNQKGIKPVKIRNILNVTMTTNSALPLKLKSASRRIYAMWSDTNPRDEFDNMLPEWLTYWEDRWSWMKSGGWRSVVHYLFTQVDLSNFDPSKAPPVTDFLREIKDASKSPMLLSLEAFIRAKHGMFKCDIATAVDLATTLRNGILAPNDMLSDPRYFSDKKVAIMLREAGGYRQVRTKRNTYWIIRRAQNYMHMSHAEIDAEYDRQIVEALSDQHLHVVEGAANVG